jgi:hypothetical protein
VYGFTLLFYQYSPAAKLIKKLIKQDWKIIRIYRENSLNQSLSHLVAEKTKMWHRFDNHETEIPKLTVSTKELKDRLKIVNKNKEAETTLFEDFAHFKVVYEDDLKNQDNWPETTRKIFEYLGVNPAPVSASIQKTYSRPYSEIIENYDELLKLVAKENLL